MNKQRIGFHWFFIICTIPIDLFSIWMSSSFGLRFDILIVAWTNSIGTTMRLISSFLPLQIRFPVGIFGQAVTACACSILEILLHFHADQIFFSVVAIF
ncbi:putative integral membrane protein [Brugia pahangi]